MKRCIACLTLIACLTVMVCPALGETALEADEQWLPMAAVAAPEIVADVAQEAEPEARTEGYLAEEDLPALSPDGPVNPYFQAARPKVEPVGLKTIASQVRLFLDGGEALSIARCVRNHSDYTGRGVTWTVTAAGGEGEYEYQFYLTDRCSSFTDPSINVNAFQDYSGDNTFYYRFVTNGDYTLFCLVRDDAGTVVRKMYNISVNAEGFKTIGEVVSDIVAQCRAAGCEGDFETAVWLHDWVVNHAYYDYGYRYYSADAVLARGTGVCDSYSKAYSLLLAEAGIPVERVLTDADSSLNHAWNVVELDGEWYQFDLTWDDDDPDHSAELVSGWESHYYCALPDALFDRNHYGYPRRHTCAAYEDNYFIRSGKVALWTALFEDSIQSDVNAYRFEWSQRAPSPYPTESAKDSGTGKEHIVYPLAAYALSERDWTVGEGEAAPTVRLDATFTQSTRKMNVTASDAALLALCAVLDGEGLSATYANLADERLSGLLEKTTDEALLTQMGRADDATLARLFGLVGDARVSALTSAMDGATAARLAAALPDDGLSRLLTLTADAALAALIGAADDALLARLLPLMADAQVGGVAALLEEADLARVMNALSDERLVRVLEASEGAGLARLFGLLADERVEPTVDQLSDSAALRLLGALDSPEALSRPMGALSDERLARLAGDMTDAQAGGLMDALAAGDLARLTPALSDERLLGGYALIPEARRAYLIGRLPDGDALRLLALVSEAEAAALVSALDGERLPGLLASAEGTALSRLIGNMDEAELLSLTRNLDDAARASLAERAFAADADALDRVLDAFTAGGDGALALPSGLVEIGEESFMGDAAIARAAIPEGVTGVGASAFEGCAGLVTAELPESALTVGARAFAGCAGLWKVIVKGADTQIDASAFEGCGHVYLYCPEGSAAEALAGGLDAVRCVPLE